MKTILPDSFFSVITKHFFPRIHVVHPIILRCIRSPCEECPYSELFWSYFPAFGLTTERYGVIKENIVIF